MFKLLEIVECQKLPKVAKSCQKLPKVAKSCPKVANRCQNLQNVAKSCQKLPKIDTCDIVNLFRQIYICKMWGAQWLELLWQRICQHFDWRKCHEKKSPSPQIQWIGLTRLSFLRTTASMLLLFIYILH